MVQHGLLDEVRALVADGLDETAPGLDATGYVELVPHLRGERSFEEALEMIRIATRQYARRQRTWLRHQLPPGARWLDARRPGDELASMIAREWMESA
jgi:tRNA dimethylallyltransferase